LQTCIDVFSKRAWAVPVRRKTGREVAEAFEKILADENCNMLQSDKGSEILNSTFQAMLRRRGIKFFTQRKRGSEGRRRRTIYQDSNNENVSPFHSREYETIPGCS